MGAVKGLAKYLNELKVEPQKTIELAYNLARFPDPLISSTGFAISCALSRDLPPEHVLAAGESLGAYVGILRSAMVEAEYS